MNDLCPRPFHNRGVDLRMLAVGGAAIRHAPRGGYRVEMAVRAAHGPATDQAEQ